MKMNEETFHKIKKQLKRVVAAGGFYAEKLKGVDIDAIQTREDFEKLPFSEKADLRDAYPLGLAAVP
ncbi:MAG: phenylacetate--CoA ligase family protein, partial [Clostridia bacterium]